MSNAESLELSVDRLLRNLNTTDSGLSAEADTRVEVYGQNVLVKRKKRTALAIFLSYFESPLVIILVLAGFVTVFGVIALALILPYTALGRLFEFVRPPWTFLLVLLTFIGTYLGLAELLKGWFYRWTDRRTAQPDSTAKTANGSLTQP